MLHIPHLLLFKTMGEIQTQTLVATETETNKKVEEFVRRKRPKSTSFNEVNIGMFNVKSANETLKDAAKTKDPNKLYDEFWYENELCCLFADSNVGKSILAVQIANEIAKKQKVLYFDFELSDKQFQRRYEDDSTKQLYKFPKNLYRVCMNHLRVFCKADELANKIMEDIERCLKETKAKVVIIDNLTWIVNNGRSMKMASELMKRLDAMKRKMNLSMLILAHTTKRNMSKPITQNDLGGSKMIYNFLDSAFSIGVSAKDPNIRFLKQVKVRYSDMKYGEANVMLCSIEKSKSFLKFNTVGYDEESEHLKKRKDSDKQAIIATIKQMKAEGMSVREIAAELGMSHATVDRWSKK